MKFHKTKAPERGTYKYTFYDENGKAQPVVVKVGVDGVTEIDIKTLHSLDDHEVYNNIKNSRPTMNDTQKDAIKKWESAHPGEVAPKNWNISIDAFNSEDNTSQDKSSVLEQAYYFANEEVSAEVESLREVVETLTEEQQKLYRLIYIEGYTETEIARAEGKSVTAIHNRLERIKKQIAKKF